MRSSSLCQTRLQIQHRRLVAFLGVLVASLLSTAWNNDGEARLLAAQDGKATPGVLISVSISPEARVKASPEGSSRVLRQGEWTEFSLTIENMAGITSPLVIESEQLLQDEGDQSRSRWLRIEWESSKPLTGALKETRQLRIWSRDQGVRSAVLNFNAGQGTQDLGFRSDVLLSFQVLGKQRED